MTARRYTSICVALILAIWEMALLYECFPKTVSEGLVIVLTGALLLCCQKRSQVEKATTDCCPTCSGEGRVPKETDGTER